MCEIIPPSPPSLPAYPLPAHTPLGMMHRPKATTLRSCEIKDDAEGMASPSDTQNKDRRTVEQGGVGGGQAGFGRREGRGGFGGERK
jgi:hypothetical protein